MKKKIIKGLITTSLVGGMAVGMAPFASADSLDTDTTVGFKTDTHIPPVTPPGQDALALLWAPTKFNFKQGHVAGSTGPAIAQKSDVNLAGGKSFVTVQDGRPTAASGEWKLTMKASELKTSATKKLTSATYTLADKDAIEYLGTSSPELTASQGSVDAAITTDPVAALPADGATEVKIASAATSAQKKWSIQVDDLTLNVPSTDVAAAVAGENYNGTITWTLSDTI